MCADCRGVAVRAGVRWSRSRRSPCPSSARHREPNKYAKLPPQIRPEDMRTTQESALSHEKGEHDRETECMLRTTGLFI